MPECGAVVEARFGWLVMTYSLRRADGVPTTSTSMTTRMMLENNCRPSPPPPPPRPPATSPPPLYGDDCFEPPHVGFTHSGALLQGFSLPVSTATTAYGAPVPAGNESALETAGNACLQRPDCVAVTESPFALHDDHMRYTLHGAGELVDYVGRTTIVRVAGNCRPPPSMPPPTHPPPSPPPPLLLMTRPLYVIRFRTVVQSTVAEFDRDAYETRMATRLGLPRSQVASSVRAASVIVTTELGTDSSDESQTLVDGINTLASDPDALNDLYGAPSTLDTSSIELEVAPSPPPAPPPPHANEGHVTIIIIVGSIVGVALLATIGALFSLGTNPPKPDASDAPGPVAGTKAPLVRAVGFDGHSTRPARMPAVGLRGELPMATRSMKVKYSRV